MPQGNGSPPVWRWPPAFPARGESQLHATGSGAWWQRGDGAAVGIMQQRWGGRGGGNETSRDGGVEDGEGGGEGATRRGALQVRAGQKRAPGTRRRRNGSLFIFPFH